MAAPLFKRGDTAYLATSAAIGHLEGYRILSIRQIEAGRWQYRIDFEKKPPEQATVGDRWDLRPIETPIFYNEEELIPLCDALTSIINNLNRQLAHIETLFAAQCPNGVPVPVVNSDEPRFEIGQQVWFRSSAKLGFLETSNVVSIQGNPGDTASKRRRFTYHLKVGRLKIGTTPKVFFYEDELATFCEAAVDVIASLNMQLVAMRQKQTGLCDS